MPRYETEGGMVSPGLIYKRISDNLKIVQEDCAMMSHLYRTDETNNHAKAMAQGWFLMSEWFKEIQHKIIMMEVGRLQ